MEKRLKKLPAGIQTFEEIIKENYIYVDKTRMLVNLIENGKVYFFARPRRFGKSLTLTTLEAMFLGKKELFKGLYAEAWMNRPDFVKYPVIRLSMNAVTTDSGIDALKESMCLRVKDIAERLDVQLVSSNLASDLFEDLIKKTAKKYQEKVVILIDEYDKPYIDFVDDPEMADKVRETLANFYVRVKANDEYLRFVLLTGISKFAKLGVFSKLNNLTDISMNDKYAALCGITHEELLQNFPDYLELTAEEMQISKEELVEKMEDFYDGFSFNGKQRLYNPYSTLMFFEDKSFDNYWFDSGTSTMIAKYLKGKNLTVEQFRNYPVSRDFVRNPGEMDSTPPEGFLYQGGFLTLREGITADFALDYPNKEVLNAMSRLVSGNLLSRNDGDYSRCFTDTINALYMLNCDKLIEALNRLLASIPYDDYKREAEDNIIYNAYTFSPKEWFYRATILTFFRGCGITVFAEMHTNKGRADLVLNYKGQIWIIEIKVAYEGESPAAKAEEACRQIVEKNYNKPYPNAICVGLAVDDSARQITEYKMIK
ncbi:MAG: ATP-binding protein [Candidatus Symbiothrix sp.]|jgi:Fe-S cluster biosynthesis and repair protein YggX|nr:ATP-binding protein [Candidatus Symbiothrix sp.]